MKIYLYTIVMLISISVLAETPKGISSCGNVKESGILFVERAMPRYPNHMPSPYVEGWVKLEITVNPEGKATHIVIVEAEPKRLFDRSAKAALKKSTYSKSNETKDRCGIVEMVYELE